jgi:hypothetical protein
MLLALAQDYRLLPDLLATGNSGPKDDSGIRPPSPVHSPVPINVEASDALRGIERATLAWEWELTRTFWLPSPFWTRPVRQAVPLSLQWSAGIIDHPPEHMIDGYYQPGIIPDHVHQWIERTAVSLLADCRRLIQPPARAVRAPEPCPRCHQHTLMGRAGSDAVRCVSAGCGYAHIAEVTV